MGPGRERIFPSVADGHGVPALRDDAGKARHDEGLERMAGIHHIPALHPGDVPDAQRGGQFCSCVRAIEHRHVVRGIPRADHSGVLRSVSEKSRLPEERESTGFDYFPRIEFSVQQLDSAGLVRGHTFGDSISGFLGMDHWRPHQRGRAVL